MFYVFVVTEGDVLDGSGLEPRAGVSKFVGDDSHTVEVRVVEIYLVVWIGPTIANGHSLKDYSCLAEEGVVADDLASEGWNVVSSEGFSSDVKRTLFECWPLLVEIGEEV